MYKTRLEFLTDGLFAIVMTLLVIEIALPRADGIVSNASLWHELMELLPEFVSYFASFTVLSMFWSLHQGIYAFFVKELDRPLVQLNLLLLAFIALVPFSAHMVATHFHTPLALVLYGVHMLLLSALFIGQFYYAKYAKEVEIDTTELTRRTYAQAIVRLYLPPIFAVFGIAAAFVSPFLALVLFAFPIIFNVIPGTLNFAERTLGIRLPE